MNELTKFNFSGMAVRVVIINGEPWWIAKDVCDILGYTWSGTSRIEHVPVEWRGATAVVTPSGTQEMLCLSEQGLYFFLGRSDKPSALPFQKWIAGDVVPSIRKTGSYGVQKDLSRKEILELALQAEIALERSNLIVKEQKLLIEQQQPKVVMADCFLTAKNNHTLETAAKLLDVGSVNLCKFLHYSKIFFLTKENRNTPYRQYEGKFFEIIDASYRAKDELRNKPQTLVTPEGLEMIRVLIFSDWSTWYPNRNRSNAEVKV